MERPVKVACVQVEPVVLDREATLDKLETVAREAAGEGAELVVFPETFVPVYPSSRWAKAFAGWENDAREGDVRAHRAGIGRGRLAGRAAARRCRARARHLARHRRQRGRPERPGTIYNSLLYHSPAGELALHHRKLVPTNHERLVWGQGDGRGLDAVETGFGRIGGLICWENYMPLARDGALRGGGRDLHRLDRRRRRRLAADARPHRAREPRLRVSPAHFQRESAYPADFPLAPRSPAPGRSDAAAARSSRPTARTSPGRCTTRRGSSTRNSTPRGCSPNGSASTRSAITAARTSSGSVSSRGRCDERVHVLPRDQPVAEREDVDAVPLAVAGPRSPLAHGEVVADAQSRGS